MAVVAIGWPLSIVVETMPCGLSLSKGSCGTVPCLVAECYCVNLFNGAPFHRQHRALLLQAHRLVDRNQGVQEVYCIVVTSRDLEKLN